MIRLHHLENSRSQRILWLLEELELEYELVRYQRDPQTQRAPEAMKAVHPLGKSPILEHDGTVLLESGAIVEYLVNAVAGGRLGVPPSSPDYAAYLYWLHFAEGSAAFPLVLGILLDLTGAQADLLKGLVAAEAELYFDQVEERLGNVPYLAGEHFSAADIMTSFALGMGAARGLLEKRPECAAYLQRLAERPAYRRAEEKG